MKNIKKLVLGLLMVTTVFKAARADWFFSPVAGYTVLHQMGSENPGWLTIPSLAGGFVASKVMFIILRGLFPKQLEKATQAMVNAQIAKEKLSEDIHANQLIRDVVDAGTDIIAMDGALNAAHVLGTAATAYALAKLGA